ncbi:MAG: hypoxanthine phosphoribosyltransferase [Dehalococcoidia bacterium]|nr:MAG: hypoxanthine phosphoribosyltransferase [Dehalococcoidia bacterium]
MPNELKVLISQEEISKAIDRIAAEIRRDYKNEDPLMIGILKGSFIFMSDLIRKIDIPLEIDFVGLSSYGSGTESSGKIKVSSRLSRPVKDRHIIVVEDIIDTGLTTQHFIEHLKKEKAASIRLCALTEKPSRRKTETKIDYLGFTVPDKFIVGYGIDMDEKYRYLPDICYLE